MTRSQRVFLVRSTRSTRSTRPARITCTTRTTRTTRTTLRFSRRIAVSAVGSLLLLGSSFVSPAPASAQSADTSRSIRSWPFNWDSIWNMPIGSNAQYVSAGFAAPTQAGLTVDEDIIILEPGAPLQQVRLNTAGWDPRQNRCINGAGGAQIATLPIPAGFTTNGYLGSTPNHSAAVLAADGVTLHQSQPFHVCDGYATSQYIFGSGTLAGDGRVGAHGGSGLSSLGGTLRVGELRPGSGPIRHALKLNLDMQRYGGCRQDGSPCFRWPAQQSDSYATQTCTPGNPYNGGYCSGSGVLEMGSLLALPPSFDVASLTSAPARAIATALRDYGAYAADATGWDVFGIMTEWGPAGRFTNQFQADWGHGFETMTRSSCTSGNADCVWSKEVAKIIQALSVVENNSATSVGGPGTRIAACAPAFADGTGGGPATCLSSDLDKPKTTAEPSTTVGQIVAGRATSTLPLQTTSPTVATAPATLGSIATLPVTQATLAAQPDVASSVANQPDLTKVDFNEPVVEVTTATTLVGAVATPNTPTTLPTPTEIDFVTPVSVTSETGQSSVASSLKQPPTTIAGVQVLDALAAGGTAAPETLALTGSESSRTQDIVFVVGVGTLLLYLARRTPKHHRS
jgi:hypothetical protein